VTLSCDPVHLCDYRFKLSHGETPRAESSEDRLVESDLTRKVSACFVSSGMPLHCYPRLPWH